MSERVYYFLFAEGLDSFRHDCCVKKENSRCEIQLAGNFGDEADESVRDCFPII